MPERHDHRLERALRDLTAGALGRVRSRPIVHHDDGHVECEAGDYRDDDREEIEELLVSAGRHLPALWSVR